MSSARTLTRKVSRYGFIDDLRPSNKRNSVTKNQISSPVALISTTNMSTYATVSVHHRNSMSRGSISSASLSSGDSPTFPQSPYPYSVDDLSKLEPSALSPRPVGCFHHQIQRSESNRRTSKPLPKQPPDLLSPEFPMHRRVSSSRRHYQRHSPPMLQPPKSAREVGADFLFNHPFGAELAQVAEMTEEIAGMTLGAAEEEFMMSHGLQKYPSCEFGGDGVFSDQLPSFRVGWI